MGLFFSVSVCINVCLRQSLPNQFIIMHSMAIGIGEKKRGKRKKVLVFRRNSSSHRRLFFLLVGAIAEGAIGGSDMPISSAGFEL